MKRLGIISLVSLSPALSWANEGHAHPGPDAGVGAARRHPKGSAEKSEKHGAKEEEAIVLTPAQTEFRDKVVAQQRMFVREVSRGGGAAIASEKRRAIELHWEHAMRLLRVRELAEQDNDANVLRRVDELRDREDEVFIAAMRRLKGEAPPEAAGGGR